MDRFIIEETQRTTELGQLIIPAKIVENFNEEARDEALEHLITKFVSKVTGIMPEFIGVVCYSGEIEKIDVDMNDITWSVESKKDEDILTIYNNYSFIDIVELPF